MTPSVTPSPDDPISVAEVARLLGHPAPESRAAAEQVRRLVRLGLPAVQDVRPAVFFRDQVVAWLRGRSATAQAATPKRATRRPKRSPAPGAGSMAAVQRRLAELRAGG